MKKHHPVGLVVVAAGLALVSACSSGGNEGDRVPTGPRDLGDPSYTSNSTFTGQDGVIPADRRTVWNPGVTYAGGGIPERQEICVTLSPAGGNADDTPAIQQALDDCPDGQVVLLTAGTFNIYGEGLGIQRSNLTLRGAGPGQPGSGQGGTRLLRVDGETNRNYAILYVGNNPAEFAMTIDLAEDAIKGTNTIVLAENPGLNVGEYVLLDHITNNDPVVEWHDQHEGPGGGSRRWFARQDRSLAQIVEIAAVEGNTITTVAPLHWTFRTGYEAQLSRYGEPSEGVLQPFTEWVGIEDIYFEGGQGGDYHGNISLSTCAYCWIRNIESNRSVGTAVGFYGTYRSELRDSYIHSTADANPGGGGYLTGIHFGGADNLIENNIIWQGNKLITMRASGGGNVIAYNYMQDGYGDGYRDIPEVGLNAAHYTTPHMELLEGNESFNIIGESYWGNSIYITFFRNNVTGTRVNAGDLGLSDEVLRRIVALDRYSYYHNIVGNVLGAPDIRLYGEQQRFLYEATMEDLTSDSLPLPVWLVGHSGEDPNIPFDTRVAETLLRHGNYDFVSNSVAWDENLPRELPPSLYLQEKPAFFGDLPWPWVHPDREGAVDTLPAKQRFDSIHGR